MVAFALLIMVLPIPLLGHIDGREGVIQNLGKSVVLIAPSQEVAFFDTVDPGHEDGSGVTVSYPHKSGAEILIEFPAGTSLDSVKKIIHSAAGKDGQLQKDRPIAKRLRFREWVTAKEEISFQYRYVLALGLFLLLLSPIVALISGSKHDSSSA